MAERKQPPATIQPPPNPAKPGNRRAETHGAYGPEVPKRARAMVPSIFEVNRHLDPQRDRPAVIRYCAILARIERVYRWLDEVPNDPVFTRGGRAHPIFERLERWEASAERAEDKLAIAPLTRARLGETLARTVDLSTAMSEPDPDRRRALLAEVGVEDLDDEEAGG